MRERIEHRVAERNDNISVDGTEIGFSRSTAT